MKKYSSIICLLPIFAAQLLFGQTADVGIRTPVGQPEPATSSQAQREAILLDAVPIEALAVRERQLAAARAQQVNVIFRDNGAVSETAIRGVPMALRDVVITDESDLSVVMDVLSPIFGLGQGEQLVFSGKGGDSYNFREEIHGLWVEPVRIIVVLGSSNNIVAIEGTAIINRDFGVNHALDAEAAIDAVNKHIEAEGYATTQGDSEEDQAYLIYKRWDGGRTMAPWWFVEKARGSEYYVDPNGEVSSALLITH